MPEYLAPGVYIEELATGPVPIEGVSTSTAGFVGQTVRGPTEPRLVTSWLDFQRWFGGPGRPGHPASYLPFAAKGFFDNGGQRAYVARVTADGLASTITLPSAGARWCHRAGPGELDNRLSPGSARRAGGTRPTPGRPTRPASG